MVPKEVMRSQHQAEIRAGIVRPTRDRNRVNLLEGPVEDF